MHIQLKNQIKHKIQNAIHQSKQMKEGQVTNAPQEE